MNEKAKKLGVVFSPHVSVGVGGQDGKWVGSIDIGDYYYETDPYPEKEGAISELCGCLETLKLKTEQVIDELNGLCQHPTQTTYQPSPCSRRTAADCKTAR